MMTIACLLQARMTVMVTRRSRHQALFQDEKTLRLVAGTPWSLYALRRWRMVMVEER